MKKIIFLFSWMFLWTALAEVDRTELRARKTHLGGTLGMSSSPEYSDNNVTGEVGVDVGMEVAPSFGVGLSFSYTNDTLRKNDFGSLEYYAMPLLLETAYHFDESALEGYLKSFHVGTKEGVLFERWHLDTADNRDASSNEQSFVLGPLVGYDYTFAKNYSLGAEAYYLVNFRASRSDLFQAHLELKYWL